MRRYAVYRAATVRHLSEPRPFVIWQCLDREGAVIKQSRDREGAVFP